MFDANDPFELFAAWFAEAEAGEPGLPSAMCLATADGDGALSARMVLLKGADERGFVFYTNMESRKSDELNVNPRAALCFYWATLNRQVRMEGRTEAVSDAEADAYFASRKRDSQIGAWASPQSRPLASRAELERRFADFSDKFGDDPVPRPSFWSGYRLVPDWFEFWRQGASRLHDRLAFTRSAGGWTRQRLNP